MSVSEVRYHAFYGGLPAPQNMGSSSSEIELRRADAVCQQALQNLTQAKTNYHKAEESRGRLYEAMQEQIVEERNKAIQQQIATDTARLVPLSEEDLKQLDLTQRHKRLSQ